MVYKGIAIPVYWILLNKKGHSNTRERIALMKRFISQFGKKRIIKLLADREFVGKKWFQWLKSEGINFAIRIKKNTKVTNSRGDVVQVQHLCRFLKVGETLVLNDARKILEVDVYLSTRWHVIDCGNRETLRRCYCKLRTTLANRDFV